MSDVSDGSWHGTSFFKQICHACSRPKVGGSRNAQRWQTSEGSDFDSEAMRKTIYKT